MPAPTTLPVRSREKLLHRAPRRPTTMDRVRARRFLELLNTGEDEVAAFWAVASDPGIGFQRYRGMAVRPGEPELRRKLASLLQRAVPELVEQAKDLALGRLGNLGGDACQAVEEVVSGDFGDGGVARARLDAARLILAALGIREQAPAQATANVVVSLGDGLRAMRHVEARVEDAGGGPA